MIILNTLLHNTGEKSIGTTGPGESRVPQSCQSKMYYVAVWLYHLTNKQNLLRDRMRIKNLRQSCLGLSAAISYIGRGVVASAFPVSSELPRTVHGGAGC